MTQQHLSQHQVARKLAWLVPLLFSGLIACQEETGPVNNPPTETGTLPGTTQETPAPSAGSPVQNSPEESAPSSEHARSITGEVVSIDGKTYVIKDPDNKDIRVEVTSMTLVDEGIEVGDKAEVRFSADDKAIAIRKMRGA